jgi:hypothetical protein
MRGQLRREPWSTLQAREEIRNGVILGHHVQPGRIDRGPWA